MSDFSGEMAGLRRWLFDTALPLWWAVGADRAGGGFHEKIDLDGTPVALPHRARVIARQAYCYCEAGRMGWDGPWREAAMHGLDYFRGHFIARDATAVSVVGLDATVQDSGFDLYNQAFALLAFAAAHRCLGGDRKWRDLAVTLRATLTRIYAHPGGGFREDRDGRLPQRANPHMHLLESALAWMAIDDDPAWRAMADDIASLCLERFIDPATGALREFFAGDWTPVAGIDGRIVEPGHQYEWAFLLDRWARFTGRAAGPAAARLIAFADARGVDARRGVAVNAILLDGSMHDPVARLWPQCERIRAYMIDGRTKDDAGRDARLAQAVQSLRRFLDTATPGLWYDQLAADGQFIVEPARATNLYHILGVVAEFAPAPLG